MVIVVVLIIAVVFGVIAAQMVVLLCSSWILIYGGVFYLGFGGSSYTSEIAKNYFKVILAQAMQVFTFCLLIGIGQTEIRNLTVGLRTSKTITVTNYWWAFGLGGLRLGGMVGMTAPISTPGPSVQAAAIRRSTRNGMTLSPITIRVKSA